MSLKADIAAAVKKHGVPRDTGPAKKNYTEKMSVAICFAVAAELRRLGLAKVKAPTGTDKQFMGGYGTKGVDVYLSDEKHGLMLSSGTKGVVFSVSKNLKNRYRDMAVEALELHKRFVFAVCGHLLFLGASEAGGANKAFGTVLNEAVTLLDGISGRERVDEAPEIYEEMGILLFDPGKPSTVDLAPKRVPVELQAATYCKRMVQRFKKRNPFYFK